MKSEQRSLILKEQLHIIQYFIWWIGISESDIERDQSAFFLIPEEKMEGIVGSQQ